MFLTFYPSPELLRRLFNDERLVVVGQETRLPNEYPEAERTHPVSDPFGTPVTKVGLQRDEIICNVPVSNERTS